MWEVSDDNSDITPHYGCLMLWWTIYLEPNHHYSKKLGKFNNTDHEITIFDGHFKWKQACLIVWYSYTVYKRTFYILNIYIPLLYERIRIYLYVWTQVSITSKNFAISTYLLYMVTNLAIYHNWSQIAIYIGMVCYNDVCKSGYSSALESSAYSLPDYIAYKPLLRLCYTLVLFWLYYFPYFQCQYNNNYVALAC